MTSVPILELGEKKAGWKSKAEYEVSKLQQWMLLMVPF